MTILAPLKLTGIVNLLAAFPQLASGLIIARYAREPSAEYRLRGLPLQLLDMLTPAARTIDNELLDTIIARLIERKDLVEAHMEAIESCLLAYGGNHAAAAASILEYASEKGLRLATGINCLDKTLCSKLLSLNRVEAKPLRACDVIFLYEYRYEDPDDPSMYEYEEYYCTPVWLVAGRTRLIRRLSGTDYALDALEKLRRLHREKPLCYAVLRVLATHGLAVLDKMRSIVETVVDGDLAACSIEGLLAPDQAAVNIGLLRSIRDGLRVFEEELYGEPPEDYTYDDGLAAYRAGDGGLLVYGVGGLLSLAVTQQAQGPLHVTVRVLRHEEPLATRLLGLLASQGYRVAEDARG